MSKKENTRETLEVEKREAEGASSTDTNEKTDTNGTETVSEAAVGEVVPEKEATENDLLAQELAEKNRELEEAKERILRLHAEFDNFRKRTQREKEEWYQYAAQSLLENLLPVVDNLERALDTVNNMSDEVQSLFSGFDLIRRQLVEVLEKEGVQPIPALGEEFDPNIHEAIMQVPLEDGQSDNQVVEELRKGYRYKDRVLRPSLVKVAKN